MFAFKLLNMKKTYLSVLILFSALIVNAQTLLKEFRLGASGSELLLANYKTSDKIYFQFESSDLRKGIAVSDGTQGGTKELFSDDYFFISTFIGLTGSDLIFTGGYLNDNIGEGVYKINVQTGNITLLKDFDPTQEFPSIVFASNIELTPGKFIFIGYDDMHAIEPWITDGTTNGTYMIKDINPTGNALINTSIEKYFTKMNGVVYFGAGNDSTGAELWRTDGTAAGTYLVKDIYTNNSQGPMFGSNPAFLTTLNNKVFFSAYDDIYGRELWVTDGTAAGTIRLTNFSSATPDVNNLYVFDGLLYFSAYDGSNRTVYKSDGTVAGTQLVQATSAGGPINPSAIFSFKNKLSILAEDQNGVHSLYTLNGTTFSRYSFPVSVSVSSPSNLLLTSNYIYFHGYDSFGELKIFKSTESSIQNTTTNNAITISNKPMYLSNNCLIFAAQNISNGEELFSICNQQTQTVSIDKALSASLLVSVYPNPSLGQINISFEDITANQIDYTITDVLGNTVNKGIAAINNKHTILHLPEFLSNGYYILNINTKAGLASTFKIALTR